MQRSKAVRKMPPKSLIRWMVGRDLPDTTVLAQIARKGGYIRSNGVYTSGVTVTFSRPRRAGVQVATATT